MPTTAILIYRYVRYISGMGAIKSQSHDYIWSVQLENLADVTCKTALLVIVSWSECARGCLRVFPHPFIAKCGVEIGLVQVHPVLQ